MFRAPISRHPWETPPPPERITVEPPEPGTSVDPQLAVICALTFVIHLIGTLAYAVRIAGVRTQRIAVSFALFNILVLVSRTSNSFQGPFLAKRIEENIRPRRGQGLLADFRWLSLFQPRWPPRRGRG